ncbi:MAG: GspH/FimT family protein [Acidobacteria bacterium]|nr:GspH/FimT family protein [Acidobacteriota bacterium]
MMTRNGYSLVESLVALAVAALLLLSGLPTLLSTYDAWKLHSEASDLAAVLAEARLRAILGGSSVRVTASGGEYRLQPPVGVERVFPLHSGILFAGTPKSFLFSSRGTVSPGATLVLTYKSRQVSLVVSPGGRSRVVW